MRNLISSLALAAALVLPGVATADDREHAEMALYAGDFAAAHALYGRAAAAGDSCAQVALGFMHFYGEQRYGRAVQADVNTSLEWFARAADQGNAVATSMLTLLFQEPEATTPSPALAASRVAQTH